MAFRGRRIVNVLQIILLFAVVLAIVYVARAVLVIFTFSILFASDRSARPVFVATRLFLETSGVLTWRRLPSVIRKRNCWTFYAKCVRSSNNWLAGIGLAQAGLEIGVARCSANGSTTGLTPCWSISVMNL